MKQKQKNIRKGMFLYKICITYIFTMHLFALIKSIHLQLPYDRYPSTNV